MAVNPDITILLDLYGALLTEKERDALDFFYNDDLSLGEIAENENAQRRASNGRDDEKSTVTRQSVRAAIKRAEEKLYEADEKLGLRAKFAERNAQLDQIIAKARAIEEFNRSHGRVGSITNLVSSIVEISQELYE